MGRRISTLSYCDRGARSPPTPAPSAVMVLVFGLSVSVAPDEDIGRGAASGARSSKEGPLEMTGTAMAEAVSNALDHLMGVEVL